MRTLEEIATDCIDRANAAGDTGSTRASLGPHLSELAQVCGLTLEQSLPWSLIPAEVDESIMYIWNLALERELTDADFYAVAAK